MFHQGRQRRSTFRWTAHKRLRHWSPQRASCRGYCRALPVLAVGVGADWVGFPTTVSTLAVAVTVTALSLVACLLRPHRVLTVTE